MQKILKETDDEAKISDLCRTYGFSEPPITIEKENTGAWASAGKNSLKVKTGA